MCTYICIYICIYVFKYMYTPWYDQTQMQNAHLSKYSKVFAFLRILDGLYIYIYMCIIYIMYIIYVYVYIHTCIHMGFSRNVALDHQHISGPFFNMVFRSGLIQCGSIQEVSKAWHPVDFWVHWVCRDPSFFTQ